MKMSNMFRVAALLAAISALSGMAVLAGCDGHSETDAEQAAAAPVAVSPSRATSSGAQVAPEQAVGESVETTAPYWLFSAKATAQDSPDEGRKTETSLAFVGVAESCLPSEQHGAQRTDVQAGDEAARSELSQTICVPGCGIRPVTEPVTRPLPARLTMSAYQEEFDRAPDTFAPGGQQTTWQWTCNGKTQEVVAAADVVMACDTDACEEHQAVNAGVYVGTGESVPTQAPRAFFALKSTSGAAVVGAGD